MLQSRLDCEAFAGGVRLDSRKFYRFQRVFNIWLFFCFDDVMRDELCKWIEIAFIAASSAIDVFFEQFFVPLKIFFLLFAFPLLLFALSRAIGRRQLPVFVPSRVVLRFFLAVVLNVVCLCDKMSHEEPAHDVLRDQHPRVEDELFETTEVPQVVKNVVRFPFVEHRALGGSQEDSKVLFVFLGSAGPLLFYDSLARFQFKKVDVDLLGLKEIVDVVREADRTFHEEQVLGHLNIWLQVVVNGRGCIVPQRLGSIGQQVGVGLDANKVDVKIDKLLFSGADVLSIGVAGMERYFDVLKKIIAVPARKI